MKPTHTPFLGRCLVPGYLRLAAKANNLSQQTAKTRQSNAPKKHTALLSDLKALVERRYMRLKVSRYECTITSMHKRALDRLEEVENRPKYRSWS